jgi:hypothetical protein
MNNNYVGTFICARYLMTHIGVYFSRARQTGSHFGENSDGSDEKNFDPLVEPDTGLGAKSEILSEQNVNEVSVSNIANQAFQKVVSHRKLMICSFGQ